MRSLGSSHMLLASLFPYDRLRREIVRFAGARREADAAAETGVRTSTKLTQAGLTLLYGQRSPRRSGSFGATG